MKNEAQALLAIRGIGAGRGEQKPETAEGEYDRAGSGSRGSPQPGKSPKSRKTGGGPVRRCGPIHAAPTVATAQERRNPRKLRHLGCEVETNPVDGTLRVEGWSRKISEDVVAALAALGNLGSLDLPGLPI